MVPQRRGHVHVKAVVTLKSGLSQARSRQRAEAPVTQSTPSPTAMPARRYRCAQRSRRAHKPWCGNDAPEVLGGVGLFGGLFDLSGRYRELVLVSAPMASWYR